MANKISICLCPSSDLRSKNLRLGGQGEESSNRDFQGPNSDSSIYGSILSRLLECSLLLHNGSSKNVLCKFWVTQSLNLSKIFLQTTSASILLYLYLALPSDELPMFSYQVSKPKSTRLLVFYWLCHPIYSRVINSASSLTAHSIPLHCWLLN